MKETRRTQILMIFAAFFWAGAFIAGKHSSAEIPPISLTFFRMVFAFIGITSIKLFTKDKSLKIEKKDFPSILLITLTGMIGYHVLFFYALKYTTATNTSIIAAMNPIITILLGIVIFKEKIKVRNILGVIISFLGIIIVFTEGDISNLNLKHVGDFIMLLGVIMWVIYSYISKKMLEKYSPIKITSLIFGLASIILLPFTIYEIGTKFNPMEISFAAWMSVFYMAFFPSVLGYLIQQMAIKSIGTVKTAQFVNLVPVFSMIMAFFILGENVGFLQIGACILVFIGIMVNNWK